MRDLRIRCSSIGKLMAEPKGGTEVLSVAAKAYIRELAAQEIFGIDFEISSKEMEKGLLVEQHAIDLLNRVRGLSLVKNSERRTNDWVTGECDLFDAVRRRGHDLKAAWSAATFPLCEEDCNAAQRKLYEWQMRGYMWLWGCAEWEINYALVDTPDGLIRHEPMQLHIVSHIPEYMRLTTWTITRDHEKEAAMVEKVCAARNYFATVVAEFDASHRQGAASPCSSDTPTTKATLKAAARPARQALPESLFG